MTTLYIDESKSNGYVIVTAVVASGDVAQMRKSVAAMRRGGQRRIHFVKENDRRRREILSEFERMGVRATIYRAEGLSDADARELCFGAIVADAVASAVDRIVLERDDSIEKWDRGVLYRELDARGMRHKITYSHDTSAGELLLCVPDAIAWSYARGGEWSYRIEALIIEVKKLN